VETELLPHLDGMLPQDEVHVWFVDLPVWEKETASLLALLNREEQERAAHSRAVAVPTQLHELPRLVWEATIQMELPASLRSSSPQ